MKKPLFLKVIQCFTLCLLFVTIIPSQILADGENSYGYSEDASGNRTYYYSINDAMNATRKNYTVFLNKDWELSSPLNIVEGTTSRLNLNGHTIKRTDMPSSASHSGEVITLHPKSKLYLYGSLEDVSFTKDGKTIQSGGFISGGCTYNGGGIYMKKGAYLYMERVAIAFNYALNEGGGVYVSDDNCSIEMVDAKITYNSNGSKFGEGGGISVNGENFGMDLAKNSEISYNSTNGLGGGVFCSDENVTIGSTDKTGKIIHNSAVGRAGGIYLNKSDCSVSDLLIEGNSGTDAGGVYCNSTNTYLKNLTIKNNSTDDSNGGGVLIGGKEVILKDCLITGNHSASNGGGVFVVADYDIYLRDCNKIYGNTSGKNNKMDDLYLEERGLCKAYVIGEDFDGASTLGIRTGSANGRLLAKNIDSVDYVSSFFLNDSENYHISFEASDNEIWQRKGATTYAVKVNDAPVGKYARGVENITVVDNNTNKDKIFVSWDMERSSGITLSDDQLKSNTLIFTMPGNEVNLYGSYVDAVKELTLTFDNDITIGDSLPKTATLSWEFNNNPGNETVNLNWYRKDNGRYVNCDNEKVTEGSAYIFEVYANGIQNGVHVISNDTDNINIKIVCANRSVSVNEISVNDEGTINFKSNDILVGKDAISYVDPLVVAVKEGASKDDVIAKINANLTSIATSKNGYLYDVTLNQITDLEDNWFGENGIIKNNDGYYSTNIGVIENDKIRLDDNTRSTIVIVNVLPKDEQTSDTKILRINDDGIVVEGDTWYKEITFDGTGYMLDATPYTSNTVKLIGEKGKRITHELTIDGYNGKEFYTYILDDSKATTPELRDGERKVEQGVLSQQIIADYNYNNIFVYNPNGDNNWTINKGVSYTVSTEIDSYKTVRALVWTVDSNHNMSDISRKTYILDNYNISSFSGSFISKVNVTIDDLVYGVALPTKISNIDVTLSKDKVYSFTNLEIDEWSPNNDSVKNNTVYTAKIEIKTTDENNNVLYDANYLSSLDVTVNNDDRIHAYIENENNKAILYIIFPELEGTRGGYDNDDKLSYTLKDINIGDYTNEISYEEASNLNNNLDNFDLPLVILKALNNNNNQEDGFKADVTYNIVSSFNSDYYDSQEIVIEGTIKKPSYLSLNGLSNKFTLKIKVRPKVGYVPEEVINKAVTCEEYMNSKDWTWSESKKACVYKVSNTGTN